MISAGGVSWAERRVEAEAKTSAIREKRDIKMKNEGEFFSKMRRRGTSEINHSVIRNSSFPNVAPIQIQLDGSARQRGQPLAGSALPIAGKGVVCQKYCRSTLRRAMKLLGVCICSTKKAVRAFMPASISFGSTLLTNQQLCCGGGVTGRSCLLSAVMDVVIQT
jgi:hypothetical protein